MSNVPYNLKPIAFNARFESLENITGDIANNAGKLVKVNATGDGLIYGDPSGTTVAWGDISGQIQDQTDLTPSNIGAATAAEGNLANTAVQPGDLANVATSGAYSDLSGTPNLATVATSGSYTDLSNTPNLASVATSADYDDLVNTPVTGYVNAEDYGFSHTNTGEQNRLIIQDIITNQVPDGTEIRINQSNNFPCRRIYLFNHSVNIRVMGPGKWDSENGIYNLENDYVNIQDVSGLDSLFLNVGGSPNRTDRLTVTNASVYAKGDVVKVVSEEADPWTDKAGRKKGEFATVWSTDVVNNYVYLSGHLEDTYDTTQNVRVGIMQQLTARFKGKIVVNDLATGMFLIRNMYKPALDFEYEGVSESIVVNNTGGYMGDFWAKGYGIGKDTGNLSYLINDGASFRTTVHRVEGHNFRHVTTTNAGAPSFRDTDIGRYGPSRDFTVLEGLSVGALGAPFDDHEGSRRTTWINCKDISPLRTSAAYDAAFQLRGRDSTLINPACYNKYQTSGDGAMIRVHEVASGSMTVISPRFDGFKTGETFISHAETAGTYGNVNVFVSGGYIRSDNVQRISYIDHMNVTFDGTLIESANCSKDYPRFFEVQEGGQLILNKPRLVYNGDPLNNATNCEIIRQGNNSVVLGDFYFEENNVSMNFSFRSVATAGAVLDSRITALNSTGDLNSFGTYSLESFDVKYIAAPNLGSGSSMPDNAYDASIRNFRILGLPTTNTGLPSGALWNDNGTVKVV